MQIKRESDKTQRKRKGKNWIEEKESIEKNQDTNVQQYSFN